MRITVVAVGKIKERPGCGGGGSIEAYIPLRQAGDGQRTEEPISEGQPRPQGRAAGDGGQADPGEGADTSTVIACDLAGREMTSEEFSAMLGAYALAGRSDIVFLIGGPTGLAPQALKRADDRVCFSKMTFPHQLMQVILLEQVYRAFKILRNEPYHL